MDARTNPAERSSPLDSVTVRAGPGALKICHGRPSARGRTMIGGDLVPFDTIWRTGANEPTMLHATIPMEIAGMAIEPGAYSLYTVPGEVSWQVIVNRSITQWGREYRYTDEVRSQEIGRATVPAGQLREHMETFTIQADDASFVLLWETTRVVIPVEAR
jgi:hypothetical protein